MFDPDFYLDTNPDVASAEFDPASHYLACGLAENRDPHILFSQAWYRSRTNPAGIRGGTLLEDYLTNPAHRWIDPHPLFDSRWYAQQAPDVCEGPLTPLEHYLLHAQERALSPGPHFHSAWYLENNPDAAESGLDPLVYFLRFGIDLDHAPSPEFDGKAYLRAYPDVAESGTHPLLHFAMSGAAEGREPRPAPQNGTEADCRSGFSALQTALSFDPGEEACWITGQVALKPGCPTLLLTGHQSGERLYGGERSFIDLLESLEDLPLNVVSTLPNDRNGDYVDKVASLSHGLYILPCPLWEDDRAPIERLVLRFSRIIGEHDIRLVYANTIMQLEPLVAARRMGCRSVVHARELVPFDDQLCAQINLPASDIVARVLERSDFLIGNSQATCALFSRPGDRTFHVPNAAPRSAGTTTPAAHETVRFGIVSSNVAKKGLSDFVEVARRLGDGSENAEFVVIGPLTDEARAWQDEVAAGSLPSSLRFVGYRETPELAMKELDVLLNLSSFAESFGRTVVEAAAAGKPAIAYHWGAIPEVIIHGETGFLCSYRNLDEVVDRVRELAHAPEKVSRMGAQAQANAQARFSRDVLKERLEAACRAILGPEMPGQPGACGGSRPPPNASSPPRIIIPVYNALDAFEPCLAALLRNTPADRLRAIIVNDASTDPRIGQLVETLAGDTRFQVIENAENLGYTRSINIGIQAAGDRDIVLLNSDAVVTPGWLDGLQIAAMRDSKVGTVTAMSDNAGAFSFPEPDTANPIPFELEPDDFARLMIQATGRCKPVDFPTGSGFCMLIRADLIRQIGLFDEAGFPRGYGEENDFCMRAGAAGWRNVITPWSYVYHVRNASFGDEKSALVKTGVERVEQRHPGYIAAVGAASASPDMLRLRQAARQCYA